MANVVFNSGAMRLLGGATGAINFVSDTIKARLVAAGYAPNKDDEFIDAGGANDVVDHTIGTAVTLTNPAIGKDNTGDFAYIDADDVLFTSVPGGTDVAKVVYYKDTGTATTSPLICSLDVAVTPNGGNITIQHAAPASGGIAKLAT